MAFYGAHRKSPHYSDRERVHLSIEKFRGLLNERTKKSSTESTKHAKKSGTDTSEVLKQMRVSFPSLCVNETYAMLGEFGHVPGVEVGDCFSSRAELSLVGLHRPLQAGIDSKDVTFTRKDGNRELLAISLVVSGEYEDDSDQGHTIIYTGQGGKDKGAKQHSKDQKSEGGNEALRNSKIRQIPIRVIRGRRVANKKSKVFSYDGLYKVVSYVFEKGQSDFKVFKFTLVRDRDQAPLMPRGQLLLKGAAFGEKQQGGQGGSEEGNRCSVAAVAKGVVSDGGKVNIARGGRHEDQVLPSEREEEATAMDIRAATQSQVRPSVSDGGKVNIAREGRHEDQVLPSEREEEATAIDIRAATRSQNSELERELMNIDGESRKHLEDGREVHSVEEMHNKEEDETDDEDIEDGEFEVKCILKKKITKSRRRKRVTNYFVVWKGYPEEEGTWEPITNLTNCKKAIEAFEKEFGSK